jgi:hypothetical protein
VRYLGRSARLLLGLLGCASVVLAAACESPETATVHNSADVMLWLYGAAERPLGSKPGLALRPGASMQINLNVGRSRPFRSPQAAFDNTGKRIFCRVYTEADKTDGELTIEIVPGQDSC